MDYYILKYGKASEIRVTVVNNPNDDKYVDKWEYEFKDDNLVRGILYRDSELLSRTEFELDSLNRKISLKENFKHKALGWKRTDSRTLYTENKKELQFLNSTGDIQYKMIVEYDSVHFPIKITSYNSQGEFDALSTASYDYDSNTYRYKVYKNDMSVVLDQPKHFILNYILQKNEFGDVTEMYWITSNKEANVRHVIEYKYDKKGNWIRKKRRLITPDRKKVLSVISRKIKYKD